MIVLKITKKKYTQRVGKCYCYWKSVENIKVERGEEKYTIASLYRDFDDNSGNITKIVLVTDTVIKKVVLIIHKMVHGKYSIA